MTTLTFIIDILWLKLLKPLHALVLVKKYGIYILYIHIYISYNQMFIHKNQLCSYYNYFDYISHIYTLFI